MIKDAKSKPFFPRKSSVGLELLLAGLLSVLFGAVLVGADYSAFFSCNCGSLLEYYGGYVLVYAGLAAVPLGLLVLFGRDRRLLLCCFLFPLIAAFFLAPVVPTSAPDFVIGEYASSCLGHPFHAENIPIYVSVSYIALHPRTDIAGQYGLVYVPGGVPPYRNESMVFFPPLGENQIGCYG